MDIRVALIGAGSFGTTVAALCSHNAPTVLWCREPEVADQIERDHENGEYLPGFKLPSSLRATHDIEASVSQADVVIMGVPSQWFRTTLETAAPYVRPWVPIVSLAKGLEPDTKMRATEIVEEILPGHPVGVLTGPNLAKEMMAGHAAAAVLAMYDDRIAAALQPLFVGEMFRVYTNHDVIGCELGGVLKNVIAIASGMAEGLGTGDNTRAAVITRGLNEMTRLGIALGGEALTFSGLAGMGDLVATCTSPQSRNRYVGEQLGTGRAIDEIIGEMKMVAEGVKTSRVVMELADAHGLELPICYEVYRVCHEGVTAEEAYHGLLRQRVGAELHGLNDRDPGARHRRPPPRPAAAEPPQAGESADRVARRQPRDQQTL